MAIAEDGAVTVDFVVLSAAVIGLTMAITLNLGTSAHDHGERIGDKMVEVGIASY